MFLLLLSSLLLFTSLCSASRVIDLNDKLLDIYAKENRGFLIKFYAPWCHYCQELEPIYNQVAQRLYNFEPDVIVGRVDCIRFSSIAKHFSIQGFPTILYINRDKRIEFRGDRTLEDLLEFALRVHGPPVRYLSACDSLSGLQNNSNRVIFINFGHEPNADFIALAPQLQQHDWLYRSMLKCEGFDAGVYVLKGRHIKHKYDPESDGPLQGWIDRHRFPHYGKLTTGRLPMALHTRKNMVIGVVEEHRRSGVMLHPNSSETRALLEKIAFENIEELGLMESTLFVWCSDLITLNSLAIWNIQPLPNIMVLNTSTFEYYVFDQSAIVGGRKRSMTRDSVLSFLKDVFIERKARSYGGDTFWCRLKRMSHDLVTNVLSMYHGNPVLTLLLFGLPTSFLAMIVYISCYSSMFSDKDDAYERLSEEDDDDFDGEDNEDENHEKRE